MATSEQKPTTAQPPTAADSKDKHYEEVSLSISSAISKKTEPDGKAKEHHANGQEKSGAKCPFIKHEPKHIDEDLTLTLLTNNKQWKVPPETLRRIKGHSATTRDCREHFCASARMDMDYVINDHTKYDDDLVWREAREWITQFHKEKNLSEEKLTARLRDVEAEIHARHTYTQTYEELSYGAKVAWRNASRCINRIQWNRMEVIDCRHVKTAEEVFQKCLEHIRFATNGGNIITTMTVFPPPPPGKRGPRIWNIQLLRYAGYLQPDGSVIGDPANVELTQAVQRLGWVGDGGMFDFLPIVIQMSEDEEARLFPIPPEDILTIRIKHPTYAWFEALGLEWVAVPLVSNIGLSCGGINYTMTPFNGWFMGTEISRDLADEQRYNILPTVAQKMGLDPNGPPSTLWPEKANIELNVAVLYSFQQAKVSIVDHHTAAKGFMNFWETEHSVGRGVSGDWVWLVPPCAGSVSPLFHLEMVNYMQKPAYYPLEFPGKNYNYGDRKAVSFKVVARLALLLTRFQMQALDRRHKVTILFATETGNSERYAHRAAQFFRRAAVVRVLNMENYSAADLAKEEVVVVVASTFGNGDPPGNGVAFKEQLSDEKFKLPHTVKFSVFGLGSTLYTNFAAFGEYVDKRMAHVGATRITPLVKGDEIIGSELSYKKWMGSLWSSLSPEFGFTLREYEDGLKALGLDPDNNEAKKKAFTPKFALVPFDPTHPSHAPHVEAETSIHQASDRRHLFRAVVKENVELLKDADETRSTKKIVFDISGNAAVKFNVGDHLAVLPNNRTEIVNDVLMLLNISETGSHKPDTKYMFEALEADTFTGGLTDKPFTLREAFTSLLDLTTPPKPEMLSIFANFAFQPNSKAELNDLAEGGANYEKWVQHHYPTIPEALKMFFGENGPVQVPLALIIENLPRLQPRFYSISSSLKRLPTELHITVGLVQYHTHSGKLHYGVASNYLANAKAGVSVHCFTRHADFPLPASPSTPIIMVGPGTGIAPFRGFWQERLSFKKEELRKAVLFFGCRTREDELYASEYTEAKIKGALSDVFVAYSREKELKKTYVQHLIAEKRVLIWDMLKNQNASFYICGDLAMSKDVEETLKGILQTEGGLGPLESVQFLDDLRKRKRYLLDVFGATLHVKKQIDEKKATALNRFFKQPSSMVLPTSPRAAAAPQTPAFLTVTPTVTVSAEGRVDAAVDAAVAAVAGGSGSGVAAAATTKKTGLGPGGKPVFLKHNTVINFWRQQERTVKAK